MRRVSLSSALGAVLCTAALGQSTLWTSFEGRTGQALAANAQGGILLFGGESLLNPGQLLDGTYALVNNNSSWVRRESTYVPTARSGHGMAAVLRGGLPVFVMFGGIVNTGAGTAATSDTYEYTGGGWGPRNLFVQPSPRSGHAMVADPVRNRVILFGGVAGVPLNDVWEFDPTLAIWSQVSVVGGAPPPRAGHAMAYDPGTGRVIVFGGAGASSYLGDTWEYNPLARTWTNVTPIQSPLARTDAAMAWLLGYGIVLFGGRTAGQNLAQNDTYIWSPSAPFPWSYVQPTSVMTPRSGHSMVTDLTGTQVILFGGRGNFGQVPEGTWLFDGINWTERLTAPTNRYAPAMAYDETRQRHVLFGGNVTGGTSPGVRGDTWELHDTAWEMRTPANSPPPRAAAGMAYDSTRQRTVLFGGSSSALNCSGVDYADTWEWDGQNWSLRVTPNSPPATRRSPLAYDADRRKTWLFVGGDMWTYDGLDWSVGRLPERRSDFSFAYDPSRNRLVVFGGLGVAAPTGQRVLADTWEWDGSTWYRQQPANSPPGHYWSAMAFDGLQGMDFGGLDASSSAISLASSYNGINWSMMLAPLAARSRHAMVHDPARGLVLLFGGESAAGILDETWEWRRSSFQWTQVQPAVVPQARKGHALAYDPVRSRVVLFGGESPGGNAFGQTWEFDGTNWSQRAFGGPTGRTFTQMTFDPRSGKVLLYGGGASINFRRSDTWLWDGVSWVQQSPTNVPPARIGHALFTTGSRTLLFGGRVGLFEYLNDLWEWDGQDWRTVSHGSPRPRASHGMAYDRRRQRLVVFGGYNYLTCSSGVLLADTWEWDGSVWTQRFPTQSPSPRINVSMSYDASRSRVVLYGGFDFTNGVNLSDTWEWTGSNWELRLPLSSPPASSQHVSTYDIADRITVAFGPIGTWEYSVTAPARIEPYGAGCAGSTGVPALQPLPWAGPWLGDRFECDFANRPPGLALFVWGFSDQTWSGAPLPFSLAFVGSPACSLLASPDIPEVILPGVNRYVSFLLPASPMYLGMTLFGQAGFFDAGQPGTPVVVSGALRLTVGAK